MTFGTNEGTSDRVVRIVVGLALAAFAVAGGMGAPMVYVGWVLAAVLLVTGIVGFCPLYALLRVSTRRASR